ncbi:MAG: 2-oxo-4-hydroxy-4-carboxy-5-ureidoimidazoline decarboxylase [Oceanospirillaceae bacterium]|nr:2-oxo-4-hydroxy-4-carboxy-5-ureidoimidazoline decarboxylase [Oceanospirillaceae bacterium]
MQRDDFVNVFGSIYEHSSWIAQGAYDSGLTSSHDNVDQLLALMSQILESANDQQKLALINAHPDLAGKAAIAGTLTQASNNEQASAGISNCSPEEFTRFTELNSRYQAKFKFPFIMAVKDSNKLEILAAFEQRIDNDVPSEFQRALLEINKIALFRLCDL